MTKRTLRKTKKIRKHKIFGTNIRDKIKSKQISNILETAYKYGFRHFDTSPLYHSYNLFKKFLKDKSDEKSATYADKFLASTTFSNI